MTTTTATGLRKLSPHTHFRLHMAGLWCAIGYLLLLGLGWGLVAGFVPPLDPNASQQDVVDTFQDDKNRIRFGMVLVMFGALVFIPFAAVFIRFMTKIEGVPGFLTYTALLGTVGNLVVTFYPAMTWLIAAYRPDRGDDITYLMSDAGWLQFVGAATILLTMPIAVALAAFLDLSSDPVFPRWAGYLNIWIVLLIIPDQLLFFFHSGPLSWNGVFGLWIPVTAFTIWFATTFHFLRVAVLKERHAA